MRQMKICTSKPIVLSLLLAFSFVEISAELPQQTDNPSVVANMNLFNGNYRNTDTVM